MRFKNNEVSISNTAILLIFSDELKGKFNLLYVNMNTIERNKNLY